MRTLGLDVHKRFAEIAILEASTAPRRQRIGTSPAELRAFASTLSPPTKAGIQRPGRSMARGAVASALE